MLRSEIRNSAPPRLGLHWVDSERLRTLSVTRGCHSAVRVAIITALLSLASEHAFVSFKFCADLRI